MAGQRVLYWGSGGVPGWRVMATLKEKKLDFDSKQIQFSKREHKTNEGLLAINPRGQAPAFKDGDVTVNESLAAMLYLDDAYAEQPLMPKSGAARALALQRFVEADVLYQAIRPLFAAKMRGQVNTDEQKATFDSNMAAAKKELAFWDEYLAADPDFIAGDAFSLADINTLLPLYYVLRVGGTLSEYPHVKKYAERHRERASIAESWPPHWKETPAPDWLAGL